VFHGAAAGLDNPSRLKLHRRYFVI